MRRCRSLSEELQEETTTGYGGHGPERTREQRVQYDAVFPVLPGTPYASAHADNPVKLAVSAPLQVGVSRRAQLTSISDSPDLLRVPVTIPRYPTNSSMSALIDSGATLNFLHEEVVANLRLDTQQCSPIDVTVVSSDVSLGLIWIRVSRRVIPVRPEAP